MKFRRATTIPDLIEFFINPLANRHFLEVPSDAEVIDSILSIPEHFASTFTGTIAAKLSITETMTSTDVPNLSSADAAAAFALGVSEAISGVTVVASMSKALSAGAGTLDFTSLTHRGVSVSLSGLKVKYFAFANPSTNANAITIVEGASNGNAMLGSAFSLTLQPGDYVVGKITNSQTVGGSDKTIDLSGTGSQTLSLILAGG